MSDLYCLKCKKYHHHNNDICDVLSLVPVTRRCRTLANTLFEMGIDLFGVAHFTQLAVGSDNKYIINVIVELRHSYQIEIIDRLPKKWRVYTETYSDDHTPLAVPILAYYETYYYYRGKSADDRVKEIVDEFTQYLDDNYDAEAVKAIITLMCS